MQPKPRIPRKPVPQTSPIRTRAEPPPNQPYSSSSGPSTSSQEISQEFGNNTTRHPGSLNRRSASASTVSELTSDNTQSEESNQDVYNFDSDQGLENNREEQPSLNIQHEESDHEIQETSGELAHKSTSSSDFRHRGESKYWNPVYLHHWGFITYTTCLTMLAVALIVLLHLSNKNSGLSTASLGYNYGWTYGPIAVFVLLSTPWKRIDYLCKILTPWQNMKKGPQTASRSIILDTVSPTLPEGIVSAFKHRHWSLFFTSIGTITLSLMTIFSTGLFILRSTERTKSNAPMETTSFWNASQGTTSTSAAISYYGIHNAGLPYPAWTLDYAAVQPFSANGNDVLNISSITASVLVFYPAFKCEAATWNISSVSYTSSMYDATFTTDTCVVTESLYAVDSTQLFTFQSSGFPVDNYASTFIPVSCFDDEVLDHVLLAVSHATEANEEISVTSMEAVICRPDYSISTSKVTFSPELVARKQRLEIKRDVNEGLLSLPDFTPSDLGDSVRSSTQSFFIQSTNTDNISENTDSFFTLMALGIGPIIGNSTLKPLLDAKVLAYQAEKVFVGIASQFANQFLLAPRISNITGEVKFEDVRLHVQQVTALLLVVLLVLLILSTVAVLLTRPVNVVPRDPATISGLLILLQRSERLQELLRGTGFLRLSALKNSLESSSYRTESAVSHSEERQFLVKIDPMENKPRENKTESQKPPNKWWQPMGTLVWFKVLSLTLPATLIIALEIIQQLSNKRDGFVNIRSSPNTTVYGSKYIPAAVMFIVSLLHGTLYSTAAVFAPYQTLRRPGASTSRTITVNHLGSLPIVTIWSAAKIRHWAVFSTSISVVVSAFLTIFVANLYTTAPIERTTEMALRRTDRFDLAWNNSYSFDNKAGSLGNLIEYWNITYPQWTYESLVFPKISSMEIELANSQDSIRLTILALRGVLNCTVTPADQTTVVVSTRFDAVNVTGIVRNTCVGSRREDLTYSITGSRPLSESLFGTMDYMHFRNNTSLEVGEPGMGYVGGFQPPDNDPGCPSLAFSLGEYLDGDATQATASTFTCTQLIEEVMTEVVFLLPSFSLDLNNPPETNESTARYVNDEAGNIVREYQHTATLAQYDYEGSPGNFFDAVIHGRDQYPPDQLLGESNVENLINASARVYGRYMAQTISQNMRVDSVPPTMITGLLLQHNQLRLHQNQVSKVALQICLGLMFCCAAAYWILMDTKELLPRNPCSIASVASWLTGNSLWNNDRILDSNQTISDKELLHTNRLGKLRFGFGLWGDAEERNYGGVGRFGIDVEHS